MLELVDLVFNIEMSLVIGIITSFVLGFLLLMIKVPRTEYSKKIANTKNTIAVCFLICSVIFFINLRYSGISDYDVFSSLMMLVVTAMSSVVLSFSLITLLEPKDFDTDKFFLNVGCVAIFSYVLIKSFWWDASWYKTLFIIGCILLFIIQCVIHIVIFARTYARSLKALENYYDEEEDNKIKWIRFCYIIMMLTQMFVLVYLILPGGMMKVYAALYSLFMVYFSANFISFLGSHKLLLNAFAYSTLSGQDLMNRINSRKKRRAGLKEAASDDDINEVEYKRISVAIDKWVKEKKYREYDRSRDEIATELKTSREMLHLYFVTKVGKDFRTWRTELRVEDAKKMLLENRSLSINVVGEMCGFSDRANFYRQFVKFAGCSPKEWREKNEGLIG